MAGNLRFNLIRVVDEHLILFCLILCLCLQNVLRGCSVLLGPGSAALWRGQSSSQSGAAGLADLLEQYARILAQNMKQTYLNPVALVAPNIGQHQYTTYINTNILKFGVDTI